MKGSGQRFGFKGPCSPRHPKAQHIHCGCCLLVTRPRPQCPWSESSKRVHSHLLKRDPQLPRGHPSPAPNRRQAGPLPSCRSHSPGAPSGPSTAEVPIPQGPPPREGAQPSPAWGDACHPTSPDPRRTGPCPQTASSAGTACVPAQAPGVRTGAPAAAAPIRGAHTCALGPPPTWHPRAEEACSPLSWAEEPSHNRPPTPVWPQVPPCAHASGQLLPVAPAWSSAQPALRQGRPGPPRTHSGTKSGCPCLQQTLSDVGERGGPRSPGGHTGETPATRRGSTCPSQPHPTLHAQRRAVRAPRPPRAHARPTLGPPDRAAPAARHGGATARSRAPGLHPGHVWTACGGRGGGRPPGWEDPQQPHGQAPCRATRVQPQLSPSP